MDKKEIKGKLDEAKGRMKEGAGAVRGDPYQKDEGRSDQLKGKAEKAIGQVKEAYENLKKK